MYIHFTNNTKLLVCGIYGREERKEIRYQCQGKVVRRDEGVGENGGV